MQIDRGNTTLSVWTRSRGAYVWPLPSAPLLNLTSVVSRKAHGSAGTFDLDITSGTAIECRSGGAGNSYKMVFTFTNLVTSCGVPSSGSATAGPNLNQCSVNFSAPSGQYITVQLTGVTDNNSNVGNFSATMGVLVGDTNADKFVDAIDVSQTKSQSGNAVINANFREDVNVDGFIDAIDVALVKSRSGGVLNAPPPSSSSSPTPAPKSSAAPKSKPRKPAVRQ
jgi:dockerin type I repeat protein